MGTTTHYEKRCPYCGYKYHQGWYSSVQFNDNRVFFGKIYVICPKCQKSFRDKDHYELAVMDPPKGFTSKLTGSSVMGIIWGTLILSLLFIPGMHITDSLSSFFIWLGLFSLSPLAIIRDRLRYKKHLEIIEEERIESVKRLKKDPEYIKMLMAAGFDVPQECRPK